MGRHKYRPFVLLTYPLFPKTVFPLLKPWARVHVAKTRSDFLKQLPQADAVICLLTDSMDRVTLTRAKKLKVIGTYSVGVNNIDLNECRKRKIAVVHTPRVLTRATAELAVALLFAASRRIPEGDQLCRKGGFKGWQPQLLLGQSVSGKIAVLVGKGRIGQETAKFFKALGIRIVWITRRDTETQIKKKLQQAQILSFHIPLTPQTHHWLGPQRLKLLPKDCIVINTSRGSVIDETALIASLKSGKLFAAGLDVFENEPRIPPRLRKLSNVVLTPHIGSAEESTRREMARLVASGVRALFQGKRPFNLHK